MVARLGVDHPASYATLAAATAFVQHTGGVSARRQLCIAAAEQRGPGSAGCTPGILVVHRAPCRVLNNHQFYAGLEITQRAWHAWDERVQLPFRAARGRHQGGGISATVLKSPFIPDPANAIWVPERSPQTSVRLFRRER